MTAMSETAGSDVLISIRQVAKNYQLSVGFVASLLGRHAPEIKAVETVNLDIGKGEVIALAGESGSGKTTLGKVLSLLEPPTSGSIWFDGVQLEALSSKEKRRMRRRIQMIFQDPYESLDPRFTVFQTLQEPLVVHGIKGRGVAHRDMTRDVLDRVELRPPEDFLDRYPHELSGGQRQRVAVARAIILHPDFVVADEPVSMMDASVRAGVMNMMLRLRNELSLTYLFITHDLAVARYIADRIAIMYLGELVEVGNTETVINQPAHPYTQILLSAVPIPDPAYGRNRVTVPGEIPSPTNKPPGCRFHPRCPYMEDICRHRQPDIVPLAAAHVARCHFALQALRGDKARTTG